MFRKAVLMLVCFLVMNPACGKAEESNGSAKSNTVQATPETVGGMVVGEKIKLMPKDGTCAEGKVPSASSMEIQFDLKKVEPRDRLKGPKVSIPTREISVIHYQKSGSAAIPIVLGIGGFFGGMLAGAFATYDDDAINPYAAWGGALAGAVAGGYGGKKIVEKTITINVKSAE
jgi:hypothetical protein